MNLKTLILPIFSCITGKRITKNFMQGIGWSHCRPFFQSTTVLSTFDTITDRTWMQIDADFFIDQAVQIKIKNFNKNDYDRRGSTWETREFKHSSWAMWLHWSTKMGRATGIAFKILAVVQRGAYFVLKAPNKMAGMVIVDKIYLPQISSECVENIRKGSP